MGFKRPNFLLGNFYFKILRYFLVLLLPIAITGIISYWISIDSMRRDFTNIIALDLKSSAREVDIYLRAAREIGANILYDDTIRTLLVPNRSTDLRLKSEEYKIPKSILRNKNIVDDFVDDIFIYADQQKIYTEDGAEDFDTFFKSSYVIQGYNIDFWLDLLNTEQQIKILEQSRVLAASGARERNVIPVVTVINTNGYNNVAVVCISADFLHATITEDPIFPNSGFIVTDRNGAVVLASAAYKDTAAKLASTLHTKKNNEAFSRIMIDGKRYATNRVQSDVFSWSFYSFTPLSEFDAKARIILSATFITCLILLILSLIFSFVFSYYLYNPIRHIRSILADEKVASIKGRGNDIEIIDTGIKKLINDFYSHKNELQEITEAYLDKTIRLLLDGEIGDREAEIKKLLTEELGFEKNEFLCVSLKVDYSPAFYSDIPEDEQTAVRHGIKKIILTLMKTERATYLVRNGDDSYVAIANVENSETRNSFSNAINYLVACFDYDIRYCKLFWGIGNVHEGLAGLSHSFAEAEADMLEMMAEKDNSRQKKIADTIRDYIKEHHQDDIYQESIADALGVSASYASKAFRQKAGVSIKDYLDAFRMEKARELIAETEERIEDISEQVGIRNRSTFLRLFRKYASMSPSEYREKSAQSRRG